MPWPSKASGPHVLARFQARLPAVSLAQIPHIEGFVEVHFPVQILRVIREMERPMNEGVTCCDAAVPSPEVPSLSASPAIAWP
jgi:hypothetical protein